MRFIGYLILFCGVGWMGYMRISSYFARVPEMDQLANDWQRYVIAIAVMICGAILILRDDLHDR